MIVEVCQWKDYQNISIRLADFYPKKKINCLFCAKKAPSLECRGKYKWDVLNNS